MNIKRISLSGHEKVTLVSNLTTMLSAGIPILETIDCLLEDSKGNQRKVLEMLRSDLVQGRQIHISLAKFPMVFDKVTVNLIKAAEEGGTLETTLRDLKVNIQKEIEFNNKVRSAMLYPIIIGVVFIAVVLIILTFVIPKIYQVFSKLPVTLPLPTKILIFVSDILLTYTLPIILVLVMLVASMGFLYRQKREWFINIFLSLPLIKKLAREIDITRVSRSLYLLLNAGMPIVASLELVQEVVVKKEMASAIAVARKMVLEGRRLSEGFRKAKHLFPSIMIKITEAGERAGSLDKSMQDISEYFDYRVSDRLKTISILIEPVMLIIIAILIGAMMIATIGPIYGLINQIAPK